MFVNFDQYAYVGVIIGNPHQRLRTMYFGWFKASSDVGILVNALVIIGDIDDPAAKPREIAPVRMFFPWHTVQRVEVYSGDVHAHLVDEE